MPFQTLQTPDETLNRVQANISKSLLAESSGSVTIVTSSPWIIKTSDKIVQFDTTVTNGPVVLNLPDATKCNGFSFLYKKADSSGNSFKFVTTAANKQGSVQKIEGSAFPYTSSAALASGIFYSDGNNWWIK